MLSSGRSSDDKEGKEDDEELPERHEPARQEGRGGPTRVRPETQTPAVRKEDVRHSRSQIDADYFWTLCLDKERLRVNVPCSKKKEKKEKKPEINFLFKLQNFHYFCVMEASSFRMVKKFKKELMLLGKFHQTPLNHY